ncbi:MAG TPA: PH domain-containing protein [Candidatus Hydrogenedentes bacterium]|nr:PH domain-containing protein [Candidatus Hydrogenedentota bacterium]
MLNVGQHPSRETGDDTVACPHCGIRFSVPEFLTGSVVYCLACGRRFQTPIPSATRPPTLGPYASGHDETPAESLDNHLEIIWRGRPSRWKQVGGYAIGAILVATGGAMSVLSWTWESLAAHEGLARWIAWAGMPMVLLGALIMATAEIRRLRYYFVIGKTELTASTGLLNIELSRILVRDIRSLNLRARFWERLVGICDVDIGTSGTSGIEMKLIAIPRRVAETLRRIRNA